MSYSGAATRRNSLCGASNSDDRNLDGGFDRVKFKKQILLICFFD